MDKEMIERVVKALDDAWPDGHRVAALKVIKAMREPTDKIHSVSVGSIHWSSEEVWQMYIDAITGAE